MPTKKQHYIPRMILKRFTTFRIPMRKPLIYQYDKENGIERLVDIRDICRKNNLYEIKDEAGKICDEEINLIENEFSRLEYMWNKIIDKIEQKKYITQDDSCMLGVLLVLQLMRMPEVMKFTSEWLYDKSASIGNPLTKNEADRYMKLASFVWGNISPKKNWMLNLMLEKMLTDKDIAIYHSDYSFILNGESPVICLRLYDMDNGIFLLPIAENYCIGLVHKRCALHMNINKDLTHLINVNTFKNDGRFIYGNKFVLDYCSKQ